jgi:hypothetical protein
MSTTTTKAAGYKVEIPEMVEVRLPKAAWVKTVGAVFERAKTGRDWAPLPGRPDFEQSGRLVDLPPGTLLIECDDVGSKRNPLKRVDLSVVTLDGTLAWSVARISNNEWAIKLREIAREWLELDARARIVKACRSEARYNRGLKTDAEDVIAKIDEQLPSFESTRNPNAFHVPAFSQQYRGPNGPDSFDAMRAAIIEFRAGMVDKAIEERAKLDEAAARWDAEADSLEETTDDAPAPESDPRAAAIAAIRALMAEHGIDAAELA